MATDINISFDEFGNLRTDVFYEFHGMSEDEPLDSDWDRSWIVVPRKPTQRELFLSDQDTYCWVESSPQPTDTEDEHDCKVDPAHVTCSYYKSIPMDVAGHARLTEFIPDVNGLIVLSPKFATRFGRLPIGGINLRTAKIDANQSSLKDPEFFVLQPTGRCRFRNPKVDKALNACPFCGFRPMICQECGFGPWNCVKCGKAGRIAAHLHEGAGDKRLKISIPKGYYQRGHILEGKHWDGSDLVSRSPGSNFVSKRVLDWLLMVHAAPFYARPARMCIDGMTAKQLRQLEEVQRPLDD